MGYIRMKKLKTLKDLMFDPIDAYHIRNLKQEAIKWVKTFDNCKYQREAPGAYNEKRVAEADEPVKEFFDSGYGQDYSPEHPFNNLRKWIKHFFNLTEEDLK